MTDQKKKKALLKKLRDKYRLAIFNEQSYEELFVMRLSRLKEASLKHPPPSKQPSAV
jgi:hypothetical protein